MLRVACLQNDDGAVGDMAPSCTPGPAAQMLTNHSVVYSMGLWEKLSHVRCLILKWFSLHFKVICMWHEELICSYGMCHRRLLWNFCKSCNSVNKEGNGKLNTETRPDFWQKHRITTERFLVGYHLGMGQDMPKASCLGLCEGRCVRLLRKGCSFVTVNTIKSKARTAKSSSPSSCSFG